MALSGDRTLQRMLRALAAVAVPWHALHVLQVDERAALRGNVARNLTNLERLLLRKVAVPTDQVHAMPVDQPILHLAATGRRRALAMAAGDPPVLNIVHLGLGIDGHSASLVPGDTILEESVHNVAVTQVYAGHQRLIRTFRCLAQLDQHDAQLPVSELARHGRTSLTARLRPACQLPCGEVPPAINKTH